MRAYIFDYNGTCVFDDRFSIEGWGIIARRYGYRGTFDYEKFAGLNNRETIIKMFGSRFTDPERQAISEEKEAIYRELAGKSPEYQLVPGLRELWDQLRERKLPRAIASASIRPNIDFFIRTFGLGAWFDPDKIVYDDGSYPDKAAMISEAARRLGAQAEECVIFEDSLPGLTAARSLRPAKLIALEARPDERAPLRRKLADRVVNDYRSLRIEEL